MVCGPLEAADGQDPRFWMNRGSSCLEVEKDLPLSSALQEGDSLR
jgi:hypothetical protein